MTIDTEALKRRLALAVMKLAYFIAKYNGSASTTTPGDSTVVLEPETQPDKTKNPEIVSFGSPNCSKATEDPNTQIKDLKIGKSGLSYKWAKGDLSNWGIKNKHDAAALAVAGYGDGKKFRCAKFDWISSDRLTRDFANINDGYNGFKSADFYGASKRCFFIMSADGKRRTNVLFD